MAENEGVKAPGVKDLFKDRMSRGISPELPKDEGSESKMSDGQDLNTVNKKISELENKLASSKSLTAKDIAEAVRDAAKESRPEQDYKDVDDFQDFAKKFKDDVKSTVSDTVEQSLEEQKASLEAMKRNMELTRVIDASYTREFKLLEEFNPDGYDTYKPAIDAIRKEYPAIADFMGPVDLHSILVGREVMDEFISSKNTPKTGVKPKEKDEITSQDVVDVKPTTLDAAVAAGMRRADEARKGK